MKRFIVWTLIMGVLILGCKKKEEVKPVEKPAPLPVVTVEEPKYETYQYFDMGRRDPFVPLRGPEVSQKEVKITIEEGTKTEETGMEGWTMEGIIWDKKGKMALIKTPEQETYLFEKGSLTDKDGNPIPEIRAKLKGDGILLTKNGKDVFLKMEEKKISEGNVIE